MGCRGAICVMNVVKDLEELCEECGKGFRKKGLFGSPHTTFRIVWGVWGC